MNTDIRKALPLTESTAYILLALREAAHGYRIMQAVETLSAGTVELGPGTLYGALAALEEQGLIEAAGREGRRKYYRLTEPGMEVLAAQAGRYGVFLEAWKRAPARGAGGGDDE